MTHNIQRPTVPVQQRIQQFDQASKTDGPKTPVGDQATKAEPKKTGPSLPTDRQTEAKSGLEAQKSDLAQHAQSTQSGGLDRAPRGPRKGGSVQGGSKVEGHGSSTSTPMRSALEAFRKADPKQQADMEFKLRFPSVDLESVKLQMMVDLSDVPKLTQGTLRKAFVAAGEPVPKDLGSVDVFGLSDKVVKEYLRACPPDCGMTAKMLAGAFLGHPQGSEAPQHTEAQRLFNDKQLKVGAPIQQDGGAVSGIGVNDLAKAMKDATGPMLAHITVHDRQGYGHAYVLEQLPRASKDASQLGHLHQSFIGTHTMAEWTKHAPPQPIDLKSQHLDKLPDFLDAKSGSAQLQAYSGLYLRPEDKLADEGKFKKEARDVQIIWTLAPYDPALAAKTLAERM